MNLALDYLDHEAEMALLISNNYAVKLIKNA